MSAEHWEIITWDFSQPTPDLPPLEEGSGFHLQLWWRDFPLGQLWLPREILPVSAAELVEEAARSVAAPVGDCLLSHGFHAALPVLGDNPARDTPPDLSALLALDQPLSQLTIPDEPPALTVSVIVCTRNRPEDLRRCLASLAQLQPPASEIIVVNNNPADSATREVAASFPGVLCVEESIAGLSRARNAGLRHATGDIIAWTDDDTVARPNWIAAIRRTFADPSIAAMTGLVLAGSLETSAQVHFERDFGGFNRGYRVLTFDPQFFSAMRDRGVPAWMVGAGANMAFRRSVMEQLGFFDVRLGAGASGCSEDSEYWYRLLHAGHSIRYDPLAVVYHYHRFDDAGFASQMEAYMRGHVVALLVQYEKYRHRGNLRRLFLSLPRYYWGVARGRLEGGERGTLRAEVRGCLAGLLWYARSRLSS